MTPLVMLVTLLNFLSALSLFIPFFFVYSGGGFKRKTRKRIEDEAKPKYNINRELAEDLLFSQCCARVALVLLIVGTGTTLLFL
jgi:hypothetical protein